MAEQREPVVRTCIHCGKERPIQFRKQKCDECMANAGGASPAKKKGRAADPERLPDSLYRRPGGLGFAVQLEVDEKTKTTDIKVWQWNAHAEGDQTIWLNQVEARELLRWLDEHLARP